MRRLIKFFTLILMFFISSTVNAAIKGGVDYSIPIDYSKINLEEAENKAGFYYNSAISTQSKEDISNALVLYTILNNKSPENIIYPVRLGVLYDLSGKGRYAKGNFYKAIGINSAKPEPYFCLGEYYYKREMYKKSLKMYKEAYARGYSNHYKTLYNMGDIYEKFGDTRSALMYFLKASEINPSEDLDRRIQHADELNSNNKAYYSEK